MLNFAKTKVVLNSFIMANTTGQKFGGRTAGTPNKSTDKLRDVIKCFLETNMQDLQKNYNTLEPKDKLDFIQKILVYTTPKMNNTQVEMDIKDNVIKFQNVSKQFPKE